MSTLQTQARVKADFPRPPVDAGNRRYDKWEWREVLPDKVALVKEGYSDMLDFREVAYDAVAGEWPSQ